MKKPSVFVAIEGRLRACRNVVTLGARPNYDDYSEKEKSLIQRAGKIYYPSSFYADLFDAMGKKTFPSYHTYKCVQDKIKQTALFHLLKIPHPHTRVFYGRKKYYNIDKYFKFPFIGKIPRGSALGRGVFLIKDEASLMKYCECTDVAYIQEFIPVDRDIRVVVIGDSAVLAYWRIAPPNDFRSNISIGGSVSLDPVPKEAVDLAVHTARKCRWDDVGIDIIYHKNQPFVIEGNMKYGKTGFRTAGIDYLKMMEKMLENGEI